MGNGQSCELFPFTHTIKLMAIDCPPARSGCDNTLHRPSARRSRTQGPGQLLSGFSRPPQDMKKNTNIKKVIIVVNRIYFPINCFIYDFISPVRGIIYIRSWWLHQNTLHLVLRVALCDWLYCWATDYYDVLTLGFSHEGSASLYYKKQVMFVERIFVDITFNCLVRTRAVLCTLHESRVNVTHKQFKYYVSVYRVK